MLERTAIFFVYLDEGANNAEAHSFGLTIDPTAIYVGLDIEFSSIEAQHLEGLHDLLAQQIQGKENVEFAFVDVKFAGTRLMEEHPGNGFFSTSDSNYLAHV